MAKRSIQEIRAEYDRLWDQVWRARTSGDTGNDLDWGITQGKMMALAWVLGINWDEAGDI